MYTKRSDEMILDSVVCAGTSTSHVATYHIRSWRMNSPVDIQLLVKVLAPLSRRHCNDRDHKAATEMLRSELAAWGKSTRGQSRRRTGGAWEMAEWAMQWAGRYVIIASLAWVFCILWLPNSGWSPRASSVRPVIDSSISSSSDGGGIWKFNNAMISRFTSD